MVWKMRKKIVDLMDTGILPKYRAMVEPAPWKKQHLEAVGKMMAVFKDRGIEIPALKIKYGPPETSLILRMPDCRPTAFATFRTGTGWALLPGPISKITANSVEEIMGAYNSS